MKRFQKTILILSVSFGLSACTITPKHVEPKVVGFSESGEQDAGVQVLPNHFRLLSASSRNEYNRLIGIYGDRVGVRYNEGLTATETNTYVIDPYHWSKALEMKDMDRNAKQ